MAVIIQDEFNPAFPLVFRWTLSTANTFTEFVLPEFIKKISLRFETNAGKFSYDATDGGTTSNYGTVDADAWLELNLAIRGINNTSKTSLFLAPASNNTVVQILLEC